MKNRKKIVKDFFKKYFNLVSSKESEQVTINSVKKAMEFKGPNLLGLVLATFIASLGLHVNSTAVVIGAMLISPLMGPIMGLGLAVGISDFELMKRSLKSFSLVTLFSIITATLFFLFTPCQGEQSELLARTSPSLYDVFIALIGGLAGILALATKEKGNVIPGVAIATALMPPLCTAGFGLATWNMRYFIGALYLYFINSVFISLATFVGIRMLRFKKKNFIDKAREKRVKRYFILIAIATICPAIYLTYEIIKDTLFENHAREFINNELVFPGSQIINHEISPKNREIKVALVGAEVPEEQIRLTQIQMDKYKLKKSKLTIYQRKTTNDIDLTAIKELALGDFYNKYKTDILQQKIAIDSLNEAIIRYPNGTKFDDRLIAEVKTLYPQIATIAFAKSIRQTTMHVSADTVIYAIVSSADSLLLPELSKMEEWLRLRTGLKSIQLVLE